MSAKVLVLFIIVYTSFQKYRSDFHWFIGVLCKQTVKLLNSSKELINISRQNGQAAMDEALCDLSECLPYEINLKPEQRESIMNLLNGCDVLAVLPTGFGKSFIFQMFVISKSKLSLHNTRNNDTPTSSSCLVICPLESIIEDQIVKSRSLGISASSLTDLTPNELSNNLPQIMFASAEKV